MSVTKVNFVMMVISVIRAAIRKKRKRIHERLKISVMRVISATSMILVLMIISVKKRNHSNTKSSRS